MKTKLSQLSLLTLATLFSTHVMAQSQQQPDVYSVVERKLEKAVPLSDNSTFSSQGPWFELQREMFMYGPMERADALLKRLDTQSKEAKFALNFSASWLAENDSPEAGLAFLSKIGLKQPSSMTSYESYINAWVKNKQPEPALALLSKSNATIKAYYFPVVLTAYQSDPDQAAALYEKNYGAEAVSLPSQLKMLVIIAKSYQAKNDIPNATVYADKALAMLDAIIAKRENAEVAYYEQYIDLLNLYAFAGNKDKAIALSERLTKATGDSGSYYEHSLPGLLAFYKNNGLRLFYSVALSERIAQIDKAFAFEPKPLEELNLIRLLHSIGEKDLLEQRVEKLMTAPEYACYDNNYCYEYKMQALQYLYERKQDALADKFLNTLIAESQGQSFDQWERATKEIAKGLMEMWRSPEGQKLAANAEAIYLAEAKNNPGRRMARPYQTLAEFYSYANDTVNARRVLHEHVPDFESYTVIDFYMRAKEWDKARELMVQEDRIDSLNLTLLQNLCVTSTPVCIQHLTFTLNKLTTQVPITFKDASGNEQLYQVGKIFHSLDIKPTAEQQQIIQTLYENAAALKTKR
ncbi:tetratricopeptide repeat protein [Klebsiella sp. MISC125]|uniref:tetratricopeptide repeat protein n=1 Tax=Klebsiella sp. MISC125 TaxID=2755386 RepID=UPI003DA9CCC6